MKNILKTLLLSSVLLSLTFNGMALPNDKPAAGKKADKKERQIKGYALCAKCALKKSEKCETLIQREVKTKNGKKRLITFSLEANKVAQDFHKHVCASKEPVIAKGKLKTEGKGKKMKRILTLSSIKIDEKAKKATAKKDKKG